MGGRSSILYLISRTPAPDHAENRYSKTVKIHGKWYEFRYRLGGGGFGTVYAAKGLDGSNVAIKLIDISETPKLGAILITSYLNEVRQLIRLREESDHVVTIYDFDFNSDTGAAYIVMELGRGSLAGYIERSHAKTQLDQPGTYINPRVRQRIWKQIVDVVRTLTANNIVHMDLKPDNLILFGRTLKIIDLGISTKFDARGPSAVGTPLFSAPEVMLDTPGEERYYGPKADVWSLGAILYYMTYGEPPQYRTRAADPPSGQEQTTDRPLVDILRRTLALNPRTRISINEVLRHRYTTHQE